MTRVVIDASPLVDRPTGVGQFTLRLLEGLAERDDIELSATAVSRSGRDLVRAAIPSSVRLDDVGAPARPIRRLWSRVDHPKLDRWVGPHDVMHASFGVPPTRGTPVSTVHDLTPLRFPELRGPFTDTWISMVRRGIDRGGWVHTVSAYVRDEVIEHFDIDPDRVVAIPNGFDPSASGDADRGRAIIGSDRSILFIGTLEPRKALPDLVEAFDRLAADDRDLRLVLAGGDGWHVEQLDEAIAAAGHRDRIVRLGYVDEADRRDLLAGASVLAYPSLYEGFGLPPLEAMHAGLPVVTSTAGALPETVGDAGLLVEPSDVDALTEAIASVLGDGALRDDLTRRGRARVEQFSWDRCVTSLGDLFVRVAALR